ncbi:hypothetical protein [Gordonia sp. OPL2]|uniref:hypothetical protein n=1 Tax=Gordonia sp. OPL2 TaxID=2486274 RepID=UPI0016555018|nr:hypothetical protein [Gordonia sp. OPL2]RPA12159.1 hypothetical protein EEB19_07505 [Gordonia sp. OPL2]
MTRPGDSLGALRDQAVAGVEDLVDVLALSATLGADPTDPDQVHRPFRRVGAFDAAAFAADAHRLAAAHRAVADHLHRLPEQQVRLGRGWTGDTGMRAVAAVVDHQRRAESDLHGLRMLAEATGAASSGIDQLLRTWYLTVARLSAPLVAGVPIAEVPEAIVTGRVPLAVVVEDIASRARLYFTTAEATVRGIDDILDHLNRVTETVDLEPYPEETGTATGLSPSAPQPSAPEPSVPEPSAPDPSAPDSSAPDPSAPEPDDPSASDVPLRLTPDTAAPNTPAPDTDQATSGDRPSDSEGPAQQPKSTSTATGGRPVPAEDAGLAARPAAPGAGPDTGDVPDRHDAPDHPTGRSSGESSSAGDLALAGEE